MEKKEGEELAPGIVTEVQPLILVKNVSKGYGQKLVLKDVSFEIFPGDIFGIIGMSGSGKTTLFQLMAGLLSPDAGDVLVKKDVFGNNPHESPDYVSVHRNKTKAKKAFGFASQLPSFYEHLTAEENLLFYASLHGMEKKKAKDEVTNLLKLVNLEEDKDTLSNELSGGMQRRLDIACSLIQNPKVLFLDEPTSDLDPMMRRQVWALISDIRKKGTTIVLASHILEEVEHLCSKVAILHEKHIMGYGTLNELRHTFNRGKEVRIELAVESYDPLLKKLRRIGSIERTYQRDNALHVFSKDEKALRKVIKIVEAGKETLVSLEICDMTLNDIFEALAKKVQ